MTIIHSEDKVLKG